MTERIPKIGRRGSKIENNPMEVDPRNSTARGPIQQRDAKIAVIIVEYIVLFIFYSLEIINTNYCLE
jgi:hypothetical protein